MKLADPCVLIILGASGDLTSRKLIPAMYEMAEAGFLNPATCILGMSRTTKSDAAWRAELKPWLQKQVKDFREEVWTEFAKRIFYIAGDAATNEPYARLSARVAELDAQRKCGQNILFFMSVASELYEPIVAQIETAGMVTEGRRWCSISPNNKSWQRIIVEKPFGFDDKSAEGLNRALGRVFEEDAIYRIDHYLGKEVVQNLLVFRFANSLFEPVWNHHYIDHVQITAAETVGVGQRTAFYDKTGAIRDMIQSHLLQMMAFVAMEPPTSFSADHIRSEKIKVVNALQTPPLDNVSQWGSLGQYAADATEGAYHDLKGVEPNSKTETFAALKMHFDNWRWSKVPFYLRTGKRLARKSTQVVIEFKPPAANLFHKIMDTPMVGNRITIDIAPKEQFKIQFNTKIPGPMNIRPVEMDMNYADSFKSNAVEAYGPLMMDAMRGDQSLFKHRLEVEGAWGAIMPFLNEASAPLRKNIRGNYAPGSWGPRSATDLLARDGRTWAE